MNALLPPPYAPRMLTMLSSAPMEPVLTREGFNKLRRGCIHLFCPTCGRKQSNMPRFEGHEGLKAETADPKTA